MTYPEVPGFKTLDTETSYQAAQEMKGKSQALRSLCWTTLSVCSLTADEVARSLKQSVLAIRPRISELVKMGLVVKTDDRRANQSGKKAVIWRAVK